MIFILSLGFVLSQNYIYGAEYLNTISLQPLNVVYDVPKDYTHREGCIHRTLKMQIQDPETLVSKNPIIDSLTLYINLGYLPLRPLKYFIKDEQVKKGVNAFFENPLYVNLSLKEIAYNFQLDSQSSISFVSLIKFRTISCKNNFLSNDVIYDYNAPGSLNDLPVWTGDLIVLINSKISKKAQIQQYKDNIDAIVNTIFKNDPEDENKLYFRRNGDNVFDTYMEDSSEYLRLSKMVIYLKDVHTYLCYLKNNVNSLNLQAAVNCFNNFTETGQMKSLPFWTLPRYQVTGILLLIFVMAFYKSDKNVSLPFLFLKRV